MPRSRRLKRADFAHLKPLAKEGGAYLVLTLSKSTDNKPKFACIVSKKVALQAHERNMIKRRVLAAVRALRITTPFFFVFTSKVSAKGATYQEIQTDIEKIVEKVLHQKKYTGNTGA